MKIIPFTIPFCSSSDSNFPAQNLTILSTQPVGWMSSRFCTYPQEMLLQSHTSVDIKKIQLLSNDKKISTKIDVFVGRTLNKSVKDLNVLGSDAIKFQKIGYFTFNSNEQSNWQSRELKTVNIDQPNCNFIKLLLHKSYDNRNNPFSQVGVVALRVYGEVQQLQPPSQQRTRVLDVTKMYTMKENEYKEERLLDQQTLQQVYALQYQKEFAVKEEDFDEAKRLKLQIDELKRVGTQLKELEDKKNFAIQNEDYDQAQDLKKQIQQMRIQMGQNDGKGREIKPNMDYLKKYERVYQLIMIYIYIYQYQQENKQESIQNDTQIQQQDKYNNQFIQNNQGGYNQNNNSRFENQVESRKEQKQQNFQKEYEENDYYNDESFQPDQEIERVQTTKKLILNHDDQVIPTLANKIKNEEQENDQSVLEGPEPLNLETLNTAEQFVPYFTIDFCKKLFSKQWMMREEALVWLSGELKNPQNIKTEPKDTFDQLTLQLILMGLTDKIERVSTASMQLLQSYLSNNEIKQTEPTQKTEIPILIEHIILVLMEKSGDTNIRIKEEADKTLISMTEMVGSVILINHLMRGISTKPKLQQSARHISARLLIIYQIIKNKGTPPTNLIDFALKHLDHQAENVRTSAIYIIAELYRIQKQNVLLGLKNVRPATLLVLEDIFDKIDKGQEYEVAINPDKIRKQAVEQNQSKPKQIKNESAKMDLLAKKTTIQCEFCGIENKEFAISNKLDLHLWRECIMLTACQSCAQVVEIPVLTDHLLEECDQKQTYRTCSRCGAAVLEQLLEEHLEMNICKKTTGKVCQLCYSPIQDWKIHLKDCIKNDRRMKTEGNSQEI